VRAFRGFVYRKISEVASFEGLPTTVARAGWSVPAGRNVHCSLLAAHRSLFSGHRPPSSVFIHHFQLPITVCSFLVPHFPFPSAQHPLPAGWHHAPRSPLPAPGCDPRCPAARDPSEPGTGNGIPTRMPWYTVPCHAAPFRFVPFRAIQQNAIQSNAMPSLAMARHARGDPFRRGTERIVSGGRTGLERT
jgi:hypothetical protein